MKRCCIEVVVSHLFDLDVGRYVDICRHICVIMIINRVLGGITKENKKKKSIAMKNTIDSVDCFVFPGI